MNNKEKQFYLRDLKNIILLINTLLLLFWVQPVFGQENTPPAPTVTGTPTGPIVRISATELDQINVRSGPGPTYPLIGVLLIGQEMPANGRSSDGTWVLIEYPGVQGGIGWVYAPYVEVIGGDLPVVEPPATPTPQFTATIDPTLAAQFSFVTEPTRLATYTPAPPIVIPVYEDASQAGLVNIGIPMGFIIFILGLAGILIGMISLSQRR